MPKNDIQTDIVSSKGKILKTYDPADGKINQSLTFYCKPTATASQIQAVAVALDDLFDRGMQSIDPTSQLLQQVEITGAN